MQAAFEMPVTGTHVVESSAARPQFFREPCRTQRLRISSTRAVYVRIPLIGRPYSCPWLGLSASWPGWADHQAPGLRLPGEATNRRT